MIRIATFALSAALVLVAAAGCDNRTKTEKAMDSLKEKSAALKEKFSSGLSKLKGAMTKKELVDNANDSADTIKAKLSELKEKFEKANPEMKAKIDQQMTKLKGSLSELEEAVEKAAKDPEKTWENWKAKAVAAMEEAERAMQQQEW